jgi:lysophospholipase L1-like esterase
MNRNTKLGFLILVVTVLGFAFHPRVTQAAACAAPAQDFGSATATISISQSGSYRIWSRIMTGTAATDNSYSLEIDGTNCYVVGDNDTMPSNTWTWIDYQGGSTTTKLDVNLTAGTHTFKMIGRESAVKIDRIITASDTSCTPTSFGDNCVSGGVTPGDTTAPTVLLTAPAANASVSGSSVSLAATASDNVGVAGVQFKVDGANVGSEDTVAPYSLAWDSGTVSNGNHMITAVARDAAGNTTTSNAVTVTVNNTAAPGVIQIGETNITSTDDSANSNLLLAQTASLSQTATIQSMSFYVTTAAGQLRLGIYDDTGPSGGPGTKKAETAEFTPVVGWNTQSVTTPVSLPAGTYWLGYAPSSDGLHFRNGSTGTTKYMSFDYVHSSALPTTFSTSPTIINNNDWSLYATLNTGPLDSQAPTAPTLTATATTSTNVNLSWSGATDNVGVTGYEVFRSTGSGSATMIADLAGTVTTYSDTTVTASKDYTYYIVAKDAAANRSPNSTTRTVTTPAAPADTQAPTAPGSPIAVAMSSTTVRLSWLPSTDSGGSGLSGYNVYRNGSLVNTQGLLANIVDGTGHVTFDDSTLNPSTTYTYTIEAIDGAGNKSAKVATTPVSITTPGISSETEDGIITGNATTTADATASGGKAVRFGGATASSSLKIMALGDSLTQGGVNANLPGQMDASTINGYRLDLLNLLKTAGYTVDYVGSEQIGDSSLADKDENGFSGACIMVSPCGGGTLYPQTAAWVTSEQPDLVIMQGGENDFSNPSLTEAQDATNMQNWIQLIWSTKADTKIIVTGAPWHTTYDSLVQTYVSNLQAQGKPIRWVPYGSNIGRIDGTHPNAAGYTTWANELAPMVQQLFPAASCALPSYPDASCTGVPAGTTLTSGPGLTVTTPGVTINGVDVPWIDVKAPNVTIKNSYIHNNSTTYLIYNYSTGLVVQDSTLEGNMGTAIAPDNYTLSRANISGVENGADISNPGDGTIATPANVTIEDSYIHALSNNASSHSDGIQVGQGVQNIFIRHNYIRVQDSGTPNSNATIILWTKADPQNSNVWIENNRLDGASGTYPIFAPFLPATNIHINNNRIIPGIYNKHATSVIIGSTVTEYNGNRDDATGTLLGPDD